MHITFVLFCKEDTRTGNRVDKNANDEGIASWAGDIFKTRDPRVSEAPFADQCGGQTVVVKQFFTMAEIPLHHYTPVLNSNIMEVNQCTFSEVATHRTW